jgi:hypothetical protein
MILAVRRGRDHAPGAAAVNGGAAPGEGPADQTPSMGCSIKCKAA